MITKVISSFFFGFYLINTVLLLSSSIYNSIKITNDVEVDDTSSYFERIINGQPAPVNTFQFQVSISTNSFITERPVSYCGGVIVSQYHVLTAAHCVHYLREETTRNMLKSSSMVTVACGSVNLNSRDIRYFEIKKVVIHQRFNMSISADYDIAVLELHTKLPLHINGFKAIQLVQKSVPVGTKCILSGWGLNGPYENSYSDHLSYAVNYIINRKKCRKLLQNFTNYSITPRMICAAYDKKEPSSACVGDSGGPLVCEEELVGIISFGGRQLLPNGTETFCAYANPAIVYTNIYKLRSWILSEIRKKF